MAAPVDERPLRRSAAVVEHRLADELDLDVADQRTTRRALVVAEPEVDGRLHLALSAGADQIDLRQLLGV